MSDTNKVTLHRDGSVTYWSVYYQAWYKNTFYIPYKEICAMSSKNQKRVLNHKDKHKDKYNK